MLTLNEALAQSSPPLTSANELATRLGRIPPVSLRDLLLASDVRRFTEVITTPSGTALGGWIELIVAGDGRYVFAGHMHGSGFDPYAFRIHVFLRGIRTGLSLRKSGSVGGTIGGGSRDFDWSESGVSEALKLGWESLRDGQLQVVKSYEDTGVIGVAEDIAQDFLSFFLTQLVLGPTIAAVIVIGAELGQLTNVNFGRPDALAGVLVAGSTILLCGPNFVIPAIVAGYLAGSQLKHRLLYENEKALARLVFKDTLPFERTYLTNIKNPTSERAFVTGHLDGTILVNLGDSFDDPIGNTPNATGGNRRTTFIHELVHAWQLTHGYPPEIIWEAAINKIKGHSVYEFEYSGEKWADMNIEAQASAVATWFTLFNVPEFGLDSPMALGSPLYDYIANHIRLGVN